MIFTCTIGLLWRSFSQPAVAGQISFNWANRFGSTSSDTGNSIAVDSSNNIYITGSFTNTVDFDPGAGTTNLTSTSGSPDTFVAKYDSTGALAWAHSFGSNSSDNGNFIQVDSSGNVYVAGYFTNTVDFDPGPGTANLVANGSNLDMYILKLDTNGNYVWADGMGSANLADAAYGLRLDSSGNVVIDGYFSGTVDFDPGAGTTNLTSAGGEDFFIAKYDNNGNFIWADGMGGTGDDQNVGLEGSVIDSSDNIYATGTFRNTADFDPGAGTTNLTSAGGTDIFVVKVDSSGNLVWAKGIGGASSDEGNAITLDSSGNVFVAGDFAGTVDFDPGAGTNNMTSTAFDDIFLLKLTNAGNFTSSIHFGATGFNSVWYLNHDSSDNLYLAGRFVGTVDFDPGAGTTNLTSAGSNDALIMRLNADGSLGWANDVGGTGLDDGHAIALSTDGSVNFTGYFSNTVDFDPGPGTTSLVSAGAQDIFLTKFTQTDVPTVTTDSSSNITDTGTTVAGTITNAGGLTISDRGFDYGLTTSYTDQAGDSGSFSTGSYTKDLSGLTCATTYHYRAFATNSIGTSHGSDATFTTSACAPVGGGSFPGDGTHPSGIPINPVILPISPEPPQMPPVTPPQPDITTQPTPVSPEIQPATKPPVSGSTKPPTIQPTPTPVPEPVTTPPVQPPTQTEPPLPVTNTAPPASQPTTSPNIVAGWFRSALLIAFSTADLFLLIMLLPVASTTSAWSLAMAAIPLGLEGLRLIYLRYFYNLLSFLGLRKKRRIWGTVYDSQTKQPLDPAIVELINADTGKVVEQAITDLAGRFGFLANKGSFFLRANKTHYAFPSTKETGATDEIFDHLYHGERLELTEASTLVNPNIPMDPVGFDWNQEEKQKLMPSRFRIAYVVQLAFNTLFVIGFIFAIYNVLTTTSAWNYFVFGMYILVLLLRLILRPKHLWGRLTKSHQPLAGAILELKESQLGVVMGKARSAIDGKFFLKAPQPGEYNLIVEVSPGEPSLLESPVKVGRDSVLNKDIDIG